ncbi:helix-turn-helix domain-containing protein [Streptomyces endophytica]|uniref:Helix-turn-helix transcriptional regulator n=1 Tax=Streptomyces endophytica TaxID=2991496 RepID=A0ABY6PCA9_9ACTN|nr:helix-turn-helix transcriptional regulator [Streptomyces endophytica]UZJ31451.1 helix-turn-helix transcriptional regulator [Streptomyces endophytica]
MTNASQQVGWEFWGSELTNRREAAGLSQAELGRRLFASRALVCRFESAERRPRLEMAIQIDEALNTDGFFERLYRKLLEASPYASYFAAAADLERLATKICEFESMLVPGLLQTSAYARALMLAGSPLASDEHIEEKVRARLDRAAVLKPADRPAYWAVLHEAVLRVPVGGPAVMAEQLEHVARLVHERKILVQVLPFAAGAFSFIGKMVTLMEFEDAPPTAYTEGVYSGNLLDEPAVVRHVQQSYDLARAAALSPEASLPLIESMVEDYKQCASTT